LDDERARPTRLALAEAADLDGHEPAQRPCELVDDDAGAAVDMRGILPGENERLHEP
jgi:hypothetical protein